MIKLNERQHTLLKTELGIDDLENLDLESILGRLTGLMAEKGLDSDDEPNEFGLAIEELIGIFSAEFYG